MLYRYKHVVELHTLHINTVCSHANRADICGSKGGAPSFLTQALDGSEKSASTHHSSLFTPAKRPENPSNKRCSGLQRRSRRFGEDTYFCTCRESNHFSWLVQPVGIDCWLHTIITSFHNMNLKISSEFVQFRKPPSTCSPWLSEIQYHSSDGTALQRVAGNSLHRPRSLYHVGLYIHPYMPPKHWCVVKYNRTQKCLHWVYPVLYETPSEQVVDTTAAQVTFESWLYCD
jgi:hypothetical protein